MIPITNLFQLATSVIPLLAGIACMVKAIRIFRADLTETGNIKLAFRSHNRHAIWLFTVGVLPVISSAREIITYHPVNSAFLRVESGLIVLAWAGWYLARLKAKNRRLYGYLELLTASAVAVGILLHTSDYIRPYDTIALCSSLYLFVWAFDNLNEAAKQGKREQDNAALSCAR